jgi:hypothetical protein
MWLVVKKTDSGGERYHGPTLAHGACCHSPAACLPRPPLSKRGVCERSEKLHALDFTLHNGEVGCRARGYPVHVVLLTCETHDS